MMARAPILGTTSCPPPGDHTAHGPIFLTHTRAGGFRDAEYLRPKSDSALDCGYGVWDGIWLTWFVCAVLRIGPRPALALFVHALTGCTALRLE
jgi:hypothetical protein